VRPLRQWESGPFEQLVHAETHYKNGGDFDRRMAVISYDNAIEVSIHTYLNLHPIQRLNREYANADVQRWLSNYHAMISFFVREVTSRQLSHLCDEAEFIWYHRVRNSQYHTGGATVPEGQVLDGIREAAIWVFGTLYDLTDVEQRLTQELARRSPAPPRQDEEYNEAINDFYGELAVGGRTFSVSEILFAVDDAYYRELGAELCGTAEYEEGEEQSA
jgi:hypothetical protein